MQQSSGPWRVSTRHWGLPWGSRGPPVPCRSISKASPSSHKVQRELKPPLIGRIGFLSSCPFPAMLINKLQVVNLFFKKIFYFLVASCDLIPDSEIVFEMPTTVSRQLGASRSGGSRFSHPGHWGFGVERCLPAHLDVEGIGNTLLPRPFGFMTEIP